MKLLGIMKTIYFMKMNGSTCAAPWTPCSYFKKTNLTCSIQSLKNAKIVLRHQVLVPQPWLGLNVEKEF